MVSGFVYKSWHCDVLPGKAQLCGRGAFLGQSVGRGDGPCLRLPRAAHQLSVGEDAALVSVV